MILVMGVTGAGKSYFINQLAGSKVVEEGDSLDSCKSSSILCWACRD
jgi:predicted GTPase